MLPRWAVACNGRSAHGGSLIAKHTLRWSAPQRVSRLGILLCPNRPYVTSHAIYAAVDARIADFVSTAENDDRLVHGVYHER